MINGNEEHWLAHAPRNDEESLMRSANHSRIHIMTQLSSLTVYLRMALLGFTKPQCDMWMNITELLALIKRNLITNSRKKSA